MKGPDDLARPEPEFPPLNRRTALIAVVIVAAAAFVSAIFPLGVAL